jgi:alkylated DNA repair dioxygenase AlkB
MRLPTEVKEWQLGDGKLIYVRNWADDPPSLAPEARRMPFTPEEVTYAGRTSTVERQTVDFGLPYPYNKTAKPSVAWHPLAHAIKQRLEQQTGRQFIQCACNWYVSPSAYIGAHATRTHLSME